MSLCRTAQRYFDSLVQSGRFTRDASETIYLARQLLEMETTVYKEVYPALRGREFVPKSPMALGAKFFGYQEETMYGGGARKIIADMATDLPLVNVNRTETQGRVYPLGRAFAYSVFDLSHAAYANESLDTSLASAARFAIEQDIDGLLQVGDAAYNMLGLLNQTSTNTYVVPNGGLGSPLWTQKTADEILLDLHGIAKAAHIATKSADMSTKMLLPLDSYQLISTKPRSTTSDTTVLEFFLGTSQWVKSVEPWYACDTAGALGVKRAVAYRPEVDAVFYKMPREFQMLPAEARGLRFVVDCIAEYGGVHARKPKTITYADGI